MEGILSECVGEWNLFLNVTCNNISIIYVTAQICEGGLKEKFDLRSGSQRRRHFVGFLNVPVQAQTKHWANILTFIPRNCPILIAFYDTHGDTEDTYST